MDYLISIKTIDTCIYMCANIFGSNRKYRDHRDDQEPDTQALQIMSEALQQFWLTWMRIVDINCMSRSIYNTSYVQLNVLCSTNFLFALRKNASIVVQLLALGNKKLQVYAILLQFKHTPLFVYIKTTEQKKNLLTNKHTTIERKYNYS